MVPRRENQRDAESLSSEEKHLVRYHVAGRTCYCKGFVAAHECCYERPRKNMKREIRGTTEAKGKEEESVLEFD